MGTIAERFLGRQAAATDAQFLTARKPVFISASIVYGEFALNDDGSIVENRYFSSRHSGPMVARQSATQTSPRYGFFGSWRSGLRHPLGRLRSAFLAMLLLGSFAPAQTGSDLSLPADDLATLREQAALLLNQAASYTCSLRVERIVDKRSAGQKMEENARLDVAFIGERERYSWPGDAGFAEDELRDLLVMGLSGAGSFAEHLRTVIGGTDTVFGQPRRELQDDQTILRISYHVPAARSGYLVNLDGNEIEAAIEGEITVLANSFQILGFSLKAKDLPVNFPATAVSEAIRYQQPSGNVQQLPVEATQQMVERGVDIYDNHFRFEECRLYGSESEIRFTDNAGLSTEETVNEGASGSSAVSSNTLPNGVPMELELKTAVTWASTLTGDPVEAVLARPVKWKGQILASAGATVRGRVVELKRVSSDSAVGYFVGLQFYRIEDKGTTLPITATLEALSDMPKSARRGLAAMVHGDIIPFERMDRVRPDGQPYPNAGFIRVVADTKGLPVGFSMRWISVETSRHR
jgi:hypothetical protein